MPWVDGGRGQWVWDYGNDPYGSPTARPQSPPPSAGGGGGGAPAGGDPNVGRFGSTAHEGEGAGVARPVGTETSQAGPSPEFGSDNYVRGEWMRNVAPLQQLTLDRAGTYRGRAGAAWDSANAPRRAGLATPEEIAGTTTTPYLDPLRAEREAAVAAGRDLLQRMYGAAAIQPLSDAERAAIASRYQDQGMQQMLALGRSQAGGLAAVQGGIESAQEQAPQVAQAATQQANLEAQQRFAERAAAFGAEMDRYRAASTVTGQLGEIATTQFGQEANLGVQTADILQRATGVELELDQRQRENLGRMMTDLSRLDLDALKLSTDQSGMLLESLIRMYDIDERTAAAIRVAQIQSADKGGGNFLETLAGAALGGGLGFLAGGPAGAAMGAGMGASILSGNSMYSSMGQNVADRVPNAPAQGDGLWTNKKFEDLS